MSHASQGMLLVLVLAGAGSGLAATLTDLRTEYLENPLGLDRPRPRFQWTLVDPARGLAQVSYRIKISTGGGADGSVWDSGVVASNKTYQVRGCALTRDRHGAVRRAAGAFGPCAGSYVQASHLASHCLRSPPRTADRVRRPGAGVSHRIPLGRHRHHRRRRGRRHLHRQ